MESPPRFHIKHLPSDGVSEAPAEVAAPDRAINQAIATLRKAPGHNPLPQS